MRKIVWSDHIDNYTTVCCEDKCDEVFNAPHHFKVLNTETNEVVTEVNFQKGPIKENGINGIHHEDLLLMVETRLESFQQSPYKCEENQLALDYINKAVEALRSRTTKRVQRGVEGTSKI